MRLLINKKVNLAKLSGMSSENAADKLEDSQKVHSNAKTPRMNLVEVSLNSL
mgnify:CR=1 FL=1|jgi:hypothetical protein